MHEHFEQLRARVRAWIGGLAESGWLDADALREFDASQEASPADLFERTAARPLVVALFGGTGVGKSSLLNRLAGGQLARTGVERPTSREVTLYLHESVALENTGIPALAGGPKISRHRIDSRRGVLWIDAPDIDSTEQANRDLALSWLPYVDLLVYVVSPERYRDDVGWKVLAERSQRHGWLFVLNRFDEGDARQVDDLRTILQRAGFENPIVLRTACVSRRVEDDFEQIESIIEQLLAEHGLRELERLGIRARLDGLAAAVSDVLSALGRPESWDSLQNSARAQWHKAANAISEGLEWPIRDAAAAFAVRGPTPVERVAQQLGPLGSIVPRPALQPPAVESEPPPRRSAAAIWDEWATSRVAEAADAVEIELRRSGIAHRPIRARLDAAIGSAATTVGGHLERELRTALAQPGAAWQRALRRVTRPCVYLLPLAALGLIATQVVAGYYRATMEGAAFLGQEFAIHSGLLMLVAWAVPFLIDRKLQPSIEDSARQGLRRGLQIGLAELEKRIAEAMESASGEAAVGHAAGETLLGELSAPAAAHSRPAGRVLPRIIAQPRLRSA